MTTGEVARKPLQFLALLFAVLLLGLAPVAAHAQASAQDAAATASDSGAATAVSPAAGDAGAAAAKPAFKHYGPDMIRGEPRSGSVTFQPQHTPTGHYALWMYDDVLMPIITAIVALVFFLLLWVMIRYNKKRNPVPSRTSHNTTLEVLWTAIPVLILVGIAVPSITLLARQYRPIPKDAITIKANGYQWYWGYEYVSNGDFEVISNMMNPAKASAEGFPPLLTADHRMVVPVGVPIRLETFGKDVIHSFGVPSLWFKLDAVPGRINEKILFIEKPGIYFGQCSELCGARHGFMPIMIEARPLKEFQQWVLTQPGGKLRGQSSATDASPAAAAPAVEKVSDVKGAPAAPAKNSAPTT